jgi:hypothetical protein
MCDGGRSLAEPLHRFRTAEPGRGLCHHWIGRLRANRDRGCQVRRTKAQHRNGFFIEHIYRNYHFVGAVILWKTLAKSRIKF